jgi:hypothetical protein
MRIRNFARDWVKWFLTATDWIFALDRQLHIVYLRNRLAQAPGYRWHRIFWPAGLGHHRQYPGFGHSCLLDAKKSER